MEKFESSSKVLSAEDLKRKEEQRIGVPLTREKQEYIKKLIFSALEDPRSKYQPLTDDDMEEYWRNPNTQKAI